MVSLESMALILSLQTISVWFIINEPISDRCPDIATAIFNLGILRLLRNLRVPKIMRLRYMPTHLLEFIAVKIIAEWAYKNIWHTISNDLLYKSLPDILDYCFPPPTDTCGTQLFFGAQCKHMMYQNLGGCEVSAILTYVASSVFTLIVWFLTRPKNAWKKIVKNFKYIIRKRHILSYFLTVSIFFLVIIFQYYIKIAQHYIKNQ